MAETFKETYSLIFVFPLKFFPDQSLGLDYQILFSLEAGFLIS